MTLGLLYSQTGKNDLSAQELNTALRLDPLNSEIYYAQAQLYERQGRIDDIGPVLRKAMDLAPNDWRFPSSLGLWQMGRGKFDEAVESLKLAVQITPDNPRAFTNLGFIYLRAQRLDEAVAAYRKSIALEPAEVSYTGLGSALESLGRHVEAAEAVRAAITFNPNSYLSHGNLGTILDGMPGKESESRAAFQRAVEVGETLRKESPNDALLLARLGSYYGKLGESAKSQTLLRQAGLVGAQNPQVLFVIAQSYEHQGLRQEALARAEESLAQGFPFSRFVESKDLNNLVQDPAFKRLAVKYQPKP